MMHNSTPTPFIEHEQSRIAALSAPILGPTRTQTLLLNALQGKHVYAGTVPAATVAKRRAKNKTARRSRRLNRAH